MFSVLVIVLMLVASALAVDIGRLVFEKRNLQKAADIAALSAVNASGFCGPSGSAVDDRLRQVARDALVENGFDPDKEGNRWDLLVGESTVAGGRREFLTTGGIADPRTDSVLVSAEKTVSRSLFLGGWLGENRQKIEALGAARNQTAASYAVGSRLLALDSSNSALLDSLLSGLVGSDVSLGVVGFDGLLNAEVTLLDLWDAAPLAGIDLASGSPTALLAADMSVGQFLGLLAHALKSGGQLDARLAIETLETQMVATNRTIRLAEVLGMPKDEQPLDTEVGVADLLMAGLLAGVRDNTVQIPLELTLAQRDDSAVEGVSIDTGRGGASVELELIEPPQVAVGPPGKRADGSWRTIARTAQADLTFSLPLHVDVPGVPQPLSVVLTLDMQLARGQGALASLTCPTWVDPVAYANIAVKPGLALVDIALDLDLAGSRIMAVDIPMDLQDSATMQEFGVPPEGEAWMVSPGPAGGGTRIGNAVANELRVLSDEQFVSSSLDLAGVSLVTPLDSLSTSVSGAVVNELAPVLIGLGNTVIDPTLRALGLQVAGATIPLDSLTLGAGQAALVY
ncbi:pilus assembly protein TadG-related protein [Guyparkeria hydrothermalis]|uniref:pilus assembly protein TadG-related protein n=1 Tax=Guyparkeria hydrothermalis TaxID=923 RepID=UPI0020229B20|nr:pilus assembly protein TadG-related protein [Guyparkeria hydrothermalis]MCL7743712.1 pilus assembly protein TadG-related protein [Guyparkeria hydrothermalis]